VCPANGTPEIRLPPPLERWLRGSMASGGTTLPHSPTVVGGASPDRLPIVVSLTHRSGLKRFLIVLATSSALKEGDTGALILTHSWGLAREDVTALLDSYQIGGEQDEIGFAITMQAGMASDITSRSTLSKTLISGPLGVPCDLCSKNILPEDEYFTLTVPPHGLSIYHRTCARGGRILE